MAYRDVKTAANRVKEGGGMVAIEKKERALLREIG